ncbi:uncharacterized protein PHALS_08833 [Plasmopara halstedii]|uniref:Uncharacterized protein n=1 Tax=Plasmopara halstedii TaxID=4781 RepID=A0A0N7L4I6_PLAHL|nr:uncharacterized protein PHALS_08833 [Plasmopara halstedii]CEG38779.1 hypothetical protein PHALS_08833 [Plasmopara halstedii]|eukprot:XP_024575148.1 hypothetical protein PHALS_08833 [Plasmopara halstedii]
MAKGVWITNEMRERIAQMRNDGIPVKDIAEQMERSSNYIYRILRNMNSADPINKRQKTTAFELSTATATVPDVARSYDADEKSNRNFGDLPDPNSSILCAVENMEVSACEPEQSFEQLLSQAQARQHTVNATVLFSTETSTEDKPHALQLPNELTNASNSLNHSAELTQDITFCDHLKPTQLQLQPSTKQFPTNSRLRTQKPSSHQSSALDFSMLDEPQVKTKSSNKTRDFFGGLDDLLKQIQDEIQRLKSLIQSDLYDAQLLQMLMKFHAEIQLLQYKKTLSANELSKCAEDQGVNDQESGNLLRQKLSTEITLLSLQVDRERLELEREQIKHKTTSLICRKTLLEANASSNNVNGSFPRQ